jgi:hypothetical protein
MNNRDLADKIKRMRKEKLETMELNTFSNVKGPSHDVAEDTLNEYQARSAKTHTLVGTKVPNKRKGFRYAGSQPKGQKMKNRYKISAQLAEKKEPTSNSKTTIINTTPEQDSAMVGTQ